MLDVMRKHTRSWLIKAIFVAIILSFIFFFGYSRMQKGMQGKTGIAARVNGEAIPYGEYKLAMEDAREFYRKIFADEIPEEMWPQIRASALHKVINQALFAQLAGKLGITVTAAEIYDAISSNPNFQKDGAFEPNIYKNTFLPYFERRYGLNYEAFLKQNLLTIKAVDFLAGHVTVDEAEAKNEYKEDNTFWSFDRIEIHNAPEGDVTSGTKGNRSNEEIAKEALEALASGSNRKVQQLTKKYDLKKEHLKDITIESRYDLIPGDQENKVFSELLSLSKEKPTPSNPIRSGSSWYAFKLVDFREPSDKDWGKEKAEFISALTERKKQDYLREWQEVMKEKAKIEEYVLSAGE